MAWLALALAVHLAFVLPPSPRVELLHAQRLRPPRPAALRASEANTDSSETPPEDLISIRQCQSWIEHHVVRLGLCPYASKPYLNDRVRYVVRLAS